MRDIVKDCISAQDRIFTSASVLSADLLRLGDETERIKRSGIDMLHFDVMDGLFVDNITYGLPVLEQVRRCTDLILDVHLMITEPSRYVRKFVQAGADIVTFHLEAESDIPGTISAIRESGAVPSIAVKPATPAEAVFPYLESVGMVLVMTVEPGFGGQSFIPETVDKVRLVRAEARRAAEKKGTPDTLRIQVDGGINDKTAVLVREAGADVLVSGSYLFRAEDMSAAAGSLK
ncbi:MAG: ribulose-phosphate 3-epimerase [Ruminococcus sp.]|nr:ribulose-phosphate 3-epimerase [Ruminococcus sp.]